MDFGKRGMDPQPQKPRDSIEKRSVDATEIEELSNKFPHLAPLVLRWCQLRDERGSAAAKYDSKISDSLLIRINAILDGISGTKEYRGKVHLSVTSAELDKVSIDAISG